MDTHAASPGGFEPGSKPRVSVSILAYNHEKYIVDALEGALAQDVDFPYEIVVGEDASKDNTRAIVQSYVDRYPGVVRMTQHRENLGPHRNFKEVFAMLRGEFVALMDGDDYWIDKNKLRRQVALMDAEPDCALCCHSAKYVYEENPGKSHVVRPNGSRRVYTLAQLSEWQRIATSSMLFRRSSLPPFPEWHDKVIFGDWVLQVLLAENGTVRCLDEAMSVRRINPYSDFLGKKHSASKVLGMSIWHLERMIEHLQPKDRLAFVRSKRRRQFERCHALITEGAFQEAREALAELRASGGYDPLVAPFQPWLAQLHLQFPETCRRLRLEERRLYLHMLELRLGNWLARARRTLSRPAASSS